MTSPALVATPPPDYQPHPFQTQTNKLGVFRRYTHNPRWHPRGEDRLDLICDFPSLDAPPPPVNPEVIHEISGATLKPFAPFSNYSTAVFMAAYFSGSNVKSEKHADTVAEAIAESRFSKPELKGFSAQRENKRLDKYLNEETHPFLTQDGWHESTVDIRLPIEGKIFQSEDEAPALQSRSLFYRRITDVIKSVCTSKAAESFHFTPYTMHWIPDPDNPDKNERIYGEAYASDSMIQAQNDIDDLPRLEGDTRERVALGIMLASDAAHLTSFGTAEVWPVYLMFANQSKQERVRPSCHAVHHLAYVPSVSQSLIKRQKYLINLDTAG
ncbi:hypothetical protein EDB85DRAFT_1873456 [Lactarius pseudohatsudake]|nr:hypothetical protein EDB85DRAFT_1873456 [Lactarius pseudohatsudake]